MVGKVLPEVFSAATSHFIRMFTIEGRDGGLAHRGLSQVPSKPWGHNTSYTHWPCFVRAVSHWLHLRTPPFPFDWLDSDYSIVFLMDLQIILGLRNHQH
jgi:hypothetical protein